MILLFCGVYAVSLAVLDIGRFHWYLLVPLVLLVFRRVVQCEL